MSIRVERKQGPNAPETVYDDPTVNLLLSNGDGQRARPYVGAQTSPYETAPVCFVCVHPYIAMHPHALVSRKPLWHRAFRVAPSDAQFG
jgi:hypothetical protein